MALMIALPPFFLVYLICRANDWSKRSFQGRYGTLLKMLDTGSGNNRWTKLAILAIFFLRRFVFAVSVIYLNSFLVG